jgi:hypothetical protein
MQGYAGSLGCAREIVRLRAALDDRDLHVHGIAHLALLAVEFQEILGRPRDAGGVEEHEQPGCRQRSW